MRHLTLALALSAVLLGVASNAQAQFRAPRPQLPNYQPYQPTVSPYINLLRRGEDRRLLYQGIIRPQLDNQRFQQTQRQEINRLNTSLRTQARDSTVQFQETEKQLEEIATRFGQKRVETGHPTAFMDRRGYFPGSRGPSR